MNVPTSPRTRTEPMRWNRLLACALAAVLLVTLAPVASSASDGSGDPSVASPHGKIHGQRLDGWLGAQPVVAAGSAAPSEPTGLIAFSTGFIAVNPDESGASQVFTVHPDGTKERQLTHVPDGNQAGDPDISPDGRTIAYVSNEGGNYAVWQMHVDGTGQHQRHGQVGFDYFTPRWSPDGSRLVVTKCDNRLLSLACDLVVVRPDGTERTLLSNERVNRAPTWSPSGRFVAFDSDRGGYISTVSVVRSSGGRPHRITPPDLEGFWPSWAPGGRRLVVSSNADRPTGQVFRVGRHGNGLRQLTHLGAGAGASRRTRPTADGSC